MTSPSLTNTESPKLKGRGSGGVLCMEAEEGHT